MVNLLRWTLLLLSAASTDEDALVLANKSCVFVGAICSSFFPPV